MLFQELGHGWKSQWLHLISALERQIHTHTHTHTHTHEENEIKKPSMAAFKNTKYKGLNQTKDTLDTCAMNYKPLLRRMR